MDGVPTLGGTDRPGEPADRIEDPVGREVAPRNEEREAAVVLHEVELAVVPGLVGEDPPQPA